MSIPPATDADPVVERLGPDDAGELLTLQRSAYAEQAQLHADPFLPPLTQTLAGLLEELADPAVTALGVRRDGPRGQRLVAAVRVRRLAGDGAAPEAGAVGEVGRLVVAPDLQGQGLGTALLHTVHDLASGPPLGPLAELRLFTGEHSATNLRLYERLGYLRTHLSDGPGYRLMHLARRGDPWPRRR